MSAKKIIGTVINVSFEIILLALVVIAIYNCGLKAYDFGYSIFTQSPVSSEPGEDILVKISASDSEYDVAKLLETKGVIKDANVFFTQLKLQSSSTKIVPGEYTVNTSMNFERIIEIITGRKDSSEEDSLSEDD